MVKTEVQKLLTLLQAEYPQSFSKLDERQMQLKIELWAKEFAEDDGSLVYAATRVLMRSAREFAPNSGQIREKMNELTTPEQLDEQQAWALVSRACENGYYGYRKEFEKLPADVQRAVGRAEQLKEWAVMDSETVQSVVASNFMRSYRAGINREKEMRRIPEEIRGMIQGIANKNTMMLGEQNG